MTIPTGFVKSTIQASLARPPGGRARRARGRPARSGAPWRSRRRRSSPGRSPRTSAGSVSSTSRAAWPPTRSWMRTKSAPSMAASRSPVQVSRPVQSRAGRASAGPGRRRRRSRSGSMSSRTSSSIGSRSRLTLEALDELRRIGAAAADDGDLQAHAPSRHCGGLTPMLITLSAIVACTSPKSSTVARGRPARWLASDSSSARSRCIIRSISTCTPRSTPGEWRSRRPAADRTRPGVALRLQPDHGPARAERADPRAAPRADARTRHVRPPSADRPRLRRRALASPRRCRPAASTRQTRLVAARPESAGEAVATALGLELGSPTLYLERLRLADGEPLLLEQVHLPAERFPGLLALGPRARLAVRPPDRALRRPRRRGPRGRSSRSCCAPARRACSDRPARARRRCSSRASRPTADGTSDRIRPDVRPWRSDALLRGAGRGPADAGRGADGDEEEDRIHETSSRRRPHG